MYDSYNKSFYNSSEYGYSEEELKEKILVATGFKEKEEYKTTYWGWILSIIIFISFIIFINL